jgi:hypothetical protein
MPTYALVRTDVSPRCQREYILSRHRTLAGMVKRNAKIQHDISRGQYRGAYIPTAYRVVVDGELRPLSDADSAELMRLAYAC